MEYILFRRYRENDFSGKKMNIPALTIANENNNTIFIDNNPICCITSQIAHEYFARNNDGNGLLRGQLTYAIAFSERIRYNEDHTRRQRFTDQEIELIETKWEKYLIPNLEVILFNHDFFNADIQELEEMAKDLNIKPKER